ncbi:uncharacterized protein KY384_004018 [Bacidia gigantensis]|uniref:uncharacterized protein n=1 Tax=Bacidia gigantensis TaxID=2732470 RepID=UPI001D04380B|nr:uncharacterized protein KY384_004018 [Bacidia gigantensis]KAG8530663.1 hypothetical protein KY384_004018 [Bacidia gigantensis]
MQPFKYKSLRNGYIRIFILKGISAGRIHGKLSSESLEHGKHSYDALSYVWGERISLNKNELLIEVDGCSIQISPNLHEALCYLCKHGQQRRLWIDQICINQDDNRERSEQVSKMGLIYEYARAVQIRLGPAAKFTGEGMQILAHLAAGDECGPTPLSPWKDSGFSEGEKQGLKDIFERPWFKRMWVVQEATVSRQAIFSVGDYAFPWDRYSALRFLKRLQFAELSVLWQTQVKTSMSSLVEVVESGLLHYDSKLGSRPDLLDSMYKYQHRLATDPRDMIFSTLALTRSLDNFEVNYAETVDETYERLYSYIRKTHRNIWSDYEVLHEYDPTWYKEFKNVLRNVKTRPNLTPLSNELME